MAEEATPVGKSLKSPMDQRSLKMCYGQSQTMTTDTLSDIQGCDHLFLYILPTGVSLEECLLASV